eukprot:35832_1
MLVWVLWCALLISTTFSKPIHHLHHHSHGEEKEESAASSSSSSSSSMVKKKNLHHHSHGEKEESASSESAKKPEFPDLLPTIAEDGTLKYVSAQTKKQENWIFENNDQITVETWTLVFDGLDIVREASQSTYIAKKDSESNKLSFHKKGEDEGLDIAQMNMVLQGAFEKQFKITIARPNDEDKGTEAKTDELKTNSSAHAAYANMLMDDELSRLHDEKAEYNRLLALALQKAKRNRIIARLKS